MTQTDTTPAHGELDPHGATWCADHGRWECSATSQRSHERCHKSRIRGTARCDIHSGTTRDIAKAKGEAAILTAAWSLEAAAELAPIDLHDRMLALIHMTTARHGIYAGELHVQYEAEAAGGLVGATWAVGRGGEAVQSGEQLRALAKLEGDERDRLARYLKLAHDMGIATQVIELAQGQAEIVTIAFRAALDAAGAELLPAVRGLIVQAFLERLGRGEALQLEAGGQS